jgi:peptide/nickel transport system ATP-binding protein
MHSIPETGESNGTGGDLSAGEGLGALAETSGALAGASGTLAGASSALAEASGALVEAFGAPGEGSSAAGAASGAKGEVLRLEGLNVTFNTPDGEVAAVRDFSLAVGRGECVGVVGESGAGKSQAFLAAMGLLASNGRAQGRALWGRVDLLTQRGADLDRVRGARIGMVFQDPMTSLTPHLAVGDQVAEPIVRHLNVSWREARSRALTLLQQAHVTDAARRMTQYPHELSGGMRQRVMIAIALSCDPELLIADEPTTALDVTIQAQILALLLELKRERGMAMVLITHDFGAVAGVADRVAVMQGGRIVELDTVHAVMKAPRHPYTQALLRAVALGGEGRTAGVLTGVESAARSSVRADAMTSVRARAHADATSVAGTDGTLAAGTDSTLAAGADGTLANGADAMLPASGDDAPVALSISGLSVQFPVPRGWFARPAMLRAVDDVSLDLRAGEALGVVGESGCGKSTLARAALLLLRPTAGQVVWMGRSLEGISARELKPLRRELQIVFQDPLASLDPRMTIGEIVEEPFRVHRPELNAGDRARTVAEMLVRVGIAPDLINRYPHEFSGGQCQRIGIARAMILKPRLLVCDEPVSALDVSIQEQIVTLLADLKRESGMCILFVSHNLAVVRRLCDRVLVLYLGRMMELASSERLYTGALHPYTRDLLEAVPIPDPDVQPARLARVLGGEPPSPLNPPSGCVYRTRCPHAQDVCHERVPTWEEAEDGHRVACHRWRELLEEPGTPRRGISGS